MSTPGLLFLCVANAARSQLGEALARHLFGPAVRVQSAGSRPGQLDPDAVRALAELGIDASAQRSKSVDTIAPDTVDLVITLCAEEVCPAFLGQARRLHWPLQDPAAAPADGPPDTAEARLDRFRRTRDELLARLRALAATDPILAPTR